MPRPHRYIGHRFLRHSGSSARSAEKDLGWFNAYTYKTVRIINNWLDAFGDVLQCNSALDSSFKMASAEHVKATLLTGDDDAISTVPL